MLLIGPSQRWKSTVAGANGICRHGSGMAAFEYRQASELHDALSRHGVRYLFIGKSGAILLGFPIPRKMRISSLKNHRTMGVRWPLRYWISVLL
jgi:hypothetical protein